jgi:hypothetical protein
MRTHDAYEGGKKNHACGTVQLGWSRDRLGVQGAL